MSGFYKRSVCLFLSLLFFFSLSVSALAASGNTIVYRTRTGECYHTGSCRYLKKSKIEITLEDAVKKYGLRPCSVCNPPSLDSGSRQSATQPSGTLSSGSSATSTTRPANGEILLKSSSKTNPSTLTFVNNTEFDCVVSLLNSSDKEVLQFYVRNNKETTVDIPTGKFTIKIAYGSTWKNKTDLFGWGTFYTSSDDTLNVAKNEAWTFTFE